MTMTDTEAAIEQLDPDSTPIAPNVYEAIRRVTRDVGRVAKSGRGPATQNSYPFMPIDDIIGALQPLMAEHGLVCVPEVLKERIDVDVAKRYNADGTEARDGRQDSIRTRVRLRIAYHFVSAGDGSELTAVVVGEAHDTADKALNKAETAAYKKALTRVFTIAPGDTDPDSQDGANAEAPEAAPAPGARRTRRQQGMDRTRGVGDVTKAAVDVPSVPADVPPAASRVTVDDGSAPGASVPEVMGPTPEGLKPKEHIEPGSAAATSLGSGAPERIDPTTLDGKPAGPQTVTEVVAGTQAQTWAPDPADVKAAEEMTAPAPTKVEQRAEDIAAIKSELRRAWSARGLTREQANAIGDKVTGKPRTEWMLRKDSLAQVLKAIQNGEVAE